MQYAISQEEFKAEVEGKRLEGEDWNDSVIKELRERLYSGDAAGSNQDDQEANGELQIGDREGGKLWQVLFSFLVSICCLKVKRHLSCFLQVSIDTQI